MGTSWTEANDDANIRGGQIQIDGGAAPGTGQLRFGVGDGGSISRGIDLSGVSTATLTLAFDKNNIDVGESVQVQFAADGVNFVTLNTITNTDGSAASGNAHGNLTLALTGALSANSAIRFLGTGLNTVGEDIRIDNVAIAYGAPSTTVTSGNGSQILIGNELGSTFTAGGGNDTVFANGGDDMINWSVGDGRDFIDGGANGAAGDRVIINGNGTVEDFIVYARAEAIAAGVVVQQRGDRDRRDPQRHGRRRTRQCRGDYDQHRRRRRHCHRGRQLQSDQPELQYDHGQRRGWARHDRRVAPDLGPSAWCFFRGPAEAAPARCQSLVAASGSGPISWVS